MFCCYQFIKDSSQAEVALIIQEMGRGSRCFVSPSEKSWIEVYDEKASEMIDIDGFELFMSLLCARCGKTGIAIWVVGSYYLCFWAYDQQGNLVVSHIPDDSVDSMHVPERIGLGGPLAEFLSFVTAKSVNDEWIREELTIPQEQSDLEDFFWQILELIDVNGLGAFGDFDMLYDRNGFLCNVLSGYMMVERDGSCVGPLKNHSN
jgi:hypothetical protein